MSLILTEPKDEYRQSWEEIVSEFEEFGEKVKPYALNYRMNNYNDFLLKAEEVKKGINLGNYVPASIYFLVDNKLNKILGAITIRHILNDDLLFFQGNIGYGVRPTERNKGYASLMLSMVLIRCAELGMDKVLITCNKNNSASERTILKNGGILENEVIEDNGNIILRYWITINGCL
ncbi:MAG: acetyltransferase, gnat family [Herbinix sp.]|jgi:predicted acetyltransferase|nr:acetyltransferase, gnat family [Herbinix sp.]MDF2801781.1 acetyltransferase, gnat family [Anaerocolumna sp.]